RIIEVQDRCRPPDGTNSWHSKAHEALHTTSCFVGSLACSIHTKELELEFEREMRRGIRIEETLIVAAYERAADVMRHRGAESRHHMRTGMTHHVPLG
ncbi:MAG: hypothetical protein P4M11_02180, partial [Candidatus Pacebacteria bacterium]|nr:hypothetical protein [Candidatus Paceibacterota bacterium]